MAICENCFNRELCSSISLNKIGVHIIPQDECCNFKDRSRFVELPCKIGDTIYHIENGKIVEYIVFAIHTYSRKLRNKHKLFLTLPSDGRIHLVINDFDMANGITVFLNKEQAEQALKERERK